MANSGDTLLFHIPDLVIGGTQSRLLRLVKGLKSRGFSPRVWYSGKDGPMLRKFAKEEVSPIHMPLTSDPPSGVQDVIEMMRQVRPLVFHSLDYGGNVYDTIAARLAGVPVCVGSRQDYIRSEWFATAASDPAAKRALGHEAIRSSLSDAIIANCHAVKSSCAVAENLDCRRVSVVHNGVDVPGSRIKGSLMRTLGVTKDIVVIGNVATLKPTKGHEALLRALALLGSDCPEFLVVIAGEGRCRPTLESLIESLRLKERVRLLGEVTEPWHTFHELDLYVHPSNSEGFSNSILEAMANGLPVLATDVGGTREVVDATNGILVEKSTPEALADGLRRAFEKRSQWKEMGRAGLVRIQSCYSTERMADQYAQLYRYCLQQCGVRGMLAPVNRVTQATIADMTIREGVVG